MLSNSLKESSREHLALPLKWLVLIVYNSWSSRLNTFALCYIISGIIDIAIEFLLGLDYSLSLPNPEAYTMNTDSRLKMSGSSKPK